MVDAMESSSPTPVLTNFGRNGSSIAAPDSPASDASSTAPTRRPPGKPPGKLVGLPPERRLSAATLAGLAAAAGVAAIVLGGWAFMSGAGLSGVGTDDSVSTSPPTGFEEALALLTRPNSERLQLRGSVGRIILVVQPSNDAALVLNGLGQADSEWAYQVWVTSPDSITPRSAGLFSGREIVVPLTSPVPPGAVVAVTLEPATGSFAPTRPPKLVVERPA